MDDKDPETRFTKKAHQLLLGLGHGIYNLENILECNLNIHLLFCQE